MFLKFHIKPAAPAVIPIVTKKPNSNRSLDPVGIELKRTSN
tara:strand:- start:117 stop:239 length:123 start_codon:yes stop_codon:yes gene_type:complete